MSTVITRCGYVCSSQAENYGKLKKNQQKKQLSINVDESKYNKSNLLSKITNITSNLPGVQVTKI